MEHARFKMSGMKCGGCESTVKAAVNDISGVLSSTASARDGQVEVEYDAALTTLDAIKQAVVAKGYPLA
jgi:copper chaperone